MYPLNFAVQTYIKELDMVAIGLILLFLGLIVCILSWVAFEEKGFWPGMMVIALGGLISIIGCWIMFTNGVPLCNAPFNC